MTVGKEKQQQLQEPTSTESLGAVTKSQKHNANTSKEHVEPEYPSAWKLALTLIALCISVFLVALDQTIIAPALGAITERFNSTKDIVCIHDASCWFLCMQTNNLKLGLVWILVPSHINLFAAYLRCYLSPL